MGYANPDALVSTEWLAEHLGDPQIRPIEVDEEEKEGNDPEGFEQGDRRRPRLDQGLGGRQQLFHELEQALVAAARFRGMVAALVCF